VRLALGLARGRLGHAEVEQDPGAGARRGRLGEDPAQVAGRRFRRAAPRRLARRLGEPRHGPRVARRLGRQQVLGHALAPVLADGQQLGGAAVGAHALGRRDLLEDPGAHDRMGERQRPPRAEDAHRDEQVGGLRRGVGIEPGEVRGLRELGRLEHRHRLGEAGGVLRQAAQAHEHRPADRARAERLDVAGLVGGRRDAIFAQGIDELAHEEGDTARRALARDGEGGGGLAAQALLDQAPDGVGR
jgi:hypothetical protein